MKIVHFADLHLGVETYGRPDPATGLSTRLLDFLRAFDELVDFAIEEQVDVVLFCGDAYKSREPSQTHQREFAKRGRKFSTLLTDTGCRQALPLSAFPSRMPYSRWLRHSRI